MSPSYIGPATPQQVVKIRPGRFTRYKAEGNFPSGAAHQAWNEAQYPCGARVGVPPESGRLDANSEFFNPWQALWIPGEYATIPNVLSVKLDKKLEIGGIQTATIEVENITYPGTVGEGGKTFHTRERGTLSPLRGVIASGLPALEGEWGEIITTNEWQGRFAFAAQITVYQGYGTSLVKTFTGLIEEIDSTSHPDKIIITARDFGQVFTDERFFGWNKDPIINTPVVFVDSLSVSTKKYVGYNPNASSEAGGHPADNVLDFDEKSTWRSQAHTTAGVTEYVEIALPEGRYHFADIAMEWGGMTVYMSLRPSETTGTEFLSGPPLRKPGKSGAAQPMTEANKWLDKNGWVDLTKKEEQLVPGGFGGNSYMREWVSYPAGQQRSPFDENLSEYIVGPNTVLRLSFRNLHKLAPEEYRAGVKEFHALAEEFEEGLGRAEWVTVEDISDVVRIICQWAGFKEWDIPDTGARLPIRFIANPGEAYLDLIKQIADGIGYNFYMADPMPDGESFAGGSIEGLGGSLGVPTFRKPKVIVSDEIGSIPVITDRSLLTAINLKQSNAPLAYVIRSYGLTPAVPHEEPPVGGKRLVYTFRPPWTGTPPTYADSRLAGVLKQVVHHSPLSAMRTTLEEVRNDAWFIALQEALASVEATIEFPANPALDIEDHALLMDLGTGISTRIAVASRSSTFTDGAKREWTMQVIGPLIDSPDVSDMVAIINGTATANGTANEWGDAASGVGSSLGYG